MKNKILLLFVGASLLVGGYVLYRDIMSSKQQSLIYYSQTNVVGQPNLPVFSKSSHSSGKVVSSGSIQISSSSKTPSTTNSSSSVGSYGSSGFANNGLYANRSVSKNEIASSNMGGPMMLFFSGINKNAASLSASSGGGSLSAVSNSSATATATTLMGAPTSSTGTIIVDPGDDPDPNTIIPVGNGGYILLFLSLLYAGVVYRRKR